MAAADGCGVCTCVFDIILSATWAYSRVACTHCVPGPIGQVNLLVASLGWILRNPRHVSMRYYLPCSGLFLNALGHHPQPAPVHKCTPRASVEQWPSSFQSIKLFLCCVSSPLDVMITMLCTQARAYFRLDPGRCLRLYDLWLASGWVSGGSKKEGGAGRADGEDVEEEI